VFEAGYNKCIDNRITKTSKKCENGEILIANKTANYVVGRWSRRVKTDKDIWG